MASRTSLTALAALALFACSAVEPEPRRAVIAEQPPVDPLDAFAKPPGRSSTFPDVTTQPVASAAPTARAPTPAVPQPSPFAEATPTLSPTPLGEPRPTTPPVATLVYHELFTGEMMGRTIRWGWTLELYAPSTSGTRVAIVDREHWVGPQRSLELVPSFPLEAGTESLVAKDRFDGTWTGDAKTSLTLTFPLDSEHPITCSTKTFDVLPSSARVAMQPLPDGYRRAFWSLQGARTKVSALECARGDLAERQVWTLEPQPEGLPFAAPPGVEYAHESSGDTLQIGGVRPYTRP